MAPTPYPDGFCSLFIAQLEAHGRPHYPQAPWFTALRAADLAARVERVRRTVEQRRSGAVYCYQLEHERKEHLPPADRSPEMYELDERCSAFLMSRGLETCTSAWTPFVPPQGR